MWQRNQGVFCCGKGFLGHLRLVGADLCEGEQKGAIDCAGVVDYATYDALHAEDAGDVEAGGVVVRDGGSGISRAERAGGVPVGGKLRFVRAGVMEIVEDGFNISRHCKFAGTSVLIPLEGYSVKKFTFPILMHCFMICEEDVYEVLGVII